MSFKKRIKKVVKKALKITNPILGGKIGDKLLPDEKKDLPPGEIPHDYQKDLDDELAAYGKIGEGVRDQLNDTARRAGTFADTDEFKTTVESEAGTVERFQRGAAQSRINELRKRLGLPTSQPGTI